MTRTLARQKGLTLVELMVTITVLAVLLVVGVPSFRSLQRRNNVSSASNSLLADLGYARSEATSRGTYVSLCPSTDGQSCATSTDYTPGWIVYAYPVGTSGTDQTYSSTDTKFTLLRHTDSRAGVAVTAKDSSILSFGQQGQAERASTALPVFTVCSLNGSGVAESTTTTQGVSLSVNGSGGVSTKTLAAGGSCTPS